MKLARLINLIVMAALLAACVTTTPSGNGTQNPTGELPTPEIRVTPAPSAEAAVRAFLAAYDQADYNGMYAMLTKDSQASVTAEDFVKQHIDAISNMSLNTLEYRITTIDTNINDAEVAAHVIYRTVLVGDLERDLAFKLARAGDGWKINWNDGLIFPDLAGGKKLVMNYTTPKRGDIIDIHGNPVAKENTVVAIGIQPSYLNEDNEAETLVILSRFMGKPVEVIQGLYANAQPNWYVPVGEISGETYEKNQSLIDNMPILKTVYDARYYYFNGIAPHTVGYVQALTKEEVDAYRKQGYSLGAMVGKKGIEKTYETELAGRNGGDLYLQNPDGTLILLAHSDPYPGSSITLTIDRDFQRQVQDALGSLRGAAVVIERNTGRVLAIASSPTFDPNVLNFNNPNIQVLNDPIYMSNDPLFNRAAAGTYPLGSVFKIITLSAALQSGSFKPTDTLDCQYEWNGLPDRTRYDWTWEHYQEELAETGEGTTQPSGMLNLLAGLMRSCNPWFWEIGKTLFEQGKTTAISDMAFGFGLGNQTGFSVIDEAPGNIAAPVDVYQAVNEAIGQDPVTVTPLQVARFVAAVGNGGTLYRPQLIELIQPAIGDPIQMFMPDAQGTLPLSAENLKLVQEAMRSVVTNSKGTGHRLSIFNFPIYGKTGTAETGGVPHAWFAGYTDVQNPNKPDIAIAVFVENQGEGSQWALPIFGRIIEIYFYGGPLRAYPWESKIGVTAEPTEVVTPTPSETPEPSATP